MASETDRANLDLRLSLSSGAMSITITSELLHDGRVLVANSTRNKTFAKQAAIGDTVVVAANRFSTELSRYLAATGRPAGSPRQVEPVQSANSRTEQPRPTAFGTGTAFAVSQSSWFLTAHHVIEGADRIELQCGDLDPAVAKVVKIDPANDIALLKADIRPTAAIGLAPDSTATVGEQVFTMGFPTPDVLGIEPKYTEGVISSLTGLYNYSNVMQITVPIQPGNSGGPLVDRSGNLVGVITSTAAVKKFFSKTGTLPQNVNWAVRSEYVRPLLAGIQLVPPTNAPRNQAIKTVGGSLCLVLTSEY
jgi:S1-C subfamily serine protease